MAQKMSKGKEAVRAPAYPQVELWSDVQSYKIVCRHCGDQIDLEEVITTPPTPERPVKVEHKCSNVFKIVWDA